jgi:ribonuclease VapC
MVLDTSALVAILFDEPERDRFARVIAADPTRLVSAGTLLETGIVVEARRGESAGRELDLLLHRMRATVVALDEQQADIARSAWRRYGKGNHPAGLNLGDCFAYALARVSGQALLHKGDDFGLTDIDVVTVDG